jgi:hypothetical protein
MSVIVEPFLPDPSHSEHYITSSHEYGTIFTTQGGIDAHVLKFNIPIPTYDTPKTLSSREAIESTFLSQVDTQEKKEYLVAFILRLHSIYVSLHYTYPENTLLVVLAHSQSILGKVSIHYSHQARSDR